MDGQLCLRSVARKKAVFLASKGEMDTLARNRGIFLAGMSLSGEHRPLPLVGAAALMRLIHIISKGSIICNQPFCINW